VRITERDTSTTFYVAEALLKRKIVSLSKLIAKKTLSNGIVTVDDVNIETFDIFVRWLSRGIEVDDFQLTLNPLHVKYTPYTFEDILPIIKVYIFADEYEIPQLRKDVLYHLSDYVQQHIARKMFLANNKGRLALLFRWSYENHLAPKEITYVYKHTKANSALRRFFVDSFYDVNVEWDVSASKLLNYPKEFLVDVMVRSASLRGLANKGKDSAQRMTEWQVDGENTGQIRKRQRKS
jgi:hypothetical protein